MPAVAAKVTVIPAKKNNIPLSPSGTQVQKLRVAAYARVSTNLEEQITSYEAQVDYYTRYIQSKEDWEFVDMYTDVNYCQRNEKINNKKEEQQKFAGKYNFQKNNNP